MSGNYNSLAKTFSLLKSIVVIILLLINTNPKLNAQIVFSHDTTLTGDHEFTQGLKIVDSTVTLRIEDATIYFHQGLTIERGKLIVSGSTIHFWSGSGLVVKTNAEFLVTSPSEFRSGTEPAYVTMLNSRAVVGNCVFYNIKILVSGRAWWVPSDAWAYYFHDCDLSLTIDNPNPIFEGNRFFLSDNYFWRIDTVGVSQGEYYNLSLSGQFGTVEHCISDKGGIESAWADNRNLEFVSNTIRNAKTGIYCLGVKRIEDNFMDNVETGIVGGSTSTRLNNVRIEFNKIINVTGQAINVLGDSITIHRNIIKGNGQTAKGISLGNSSGWITNNLISDFKISESSSNNKGIGLYLYVPFPGQFRTVEVSRNIFEHCGLSETADPEIVASIVHLQSPVIFTGNELRSNTLGGVASPTFSFAGGAILNIEIPGNLDPPVIVKNNFIHSNTFINDGVYEPTQTKGTLVSINLQNRKLDFRGNTLYGSPDATLGIYLNPGGFPNGVVGDSLIFEQNTIVNNLVGVGTMAAPVLSNDNNFKDNNYHIMRYGGQKDLEMFAQNNNWYSYDATEIDNKLYDDDESSSTGPINFTNYINVSYDVTPDNPGTQNLNIGDSLEIKMRITDAQGNPIQNMPGFFSSSNANVASVTMNQPLTGSDGYITGILHTYGDGSTNVRVYAGGSVSDPIQINSGEVGVDDETTSAVIEDFKLYQNYPNPFNPVTIIQYKVGERQFVTLRIYNVLGKEVATLVDEEKSAGIHDIKFDASQFASGIYFYRIQSGYFIQTKKMILLR